MKTTLLIFALLAGALRATDALTSPASLTFNGTLATGLAASTILIIDCGAGHISISFKDGSVKFVDCDPPEAARAFWSNVAQAFPEMKMVMIQQEKPSQPKAPAIIWGNDALREHPEWFDESGLKPSTVNFCWAIIKLPKGPSFEFGLRSDGVVVWRKK